MKIFLIYLLLLYYIYISTFPYMDIKISSQWMIFGLCCMVSPFHEFKSWLLTESSGPVQFVNWYLIFAAIHFSNFVRKLTKTFYSTIFRFPIIAILEKLQALGLGSNREINRQIKYILVK